MEKVANKELNRLKTIPAASSEYTVARTYLDWIAELPWAKTSEDNLDIENARAMLDADHYGLEKVKKRILEYLAVRKLKNDMKGPILCLVGPPGVGKTSLGQSIARRVGRKFVRISLGGVRDEAEIRGHRRTYVGALPGRIIQGMKKAGTNNPVFMLDEIDKLGADFRGDPSAALLEVLDPEQNNTLLRPLPRRAVRPVEGDVHRHRQPARPHPRPAAGPHGDHRAVRLHPRGEAADRPASTWCPSSSRSTGCPTDHIAIEDEALLTLITAYTREAGVRNLERRIADVCRAVAVEVAGGQDRQADHHVGPGEGDPRARDASTRRSPSAPRCRAWPRAWPGRRWAATSSSSRRPRWPARAA